MIIYKDVVSGTEILTDAYPITDLGCVYRVQGKTQKVDSSVNVDIGANPSAEGEDESDVADGEIVSVVNVVNASRLEETDISKGSYKKHIKEYMKRVMDYLKENKPERLDAFKTEAQEQVKKILANFDEYRFWTGEDMNPDGMIILNAYEKCEGFDIEQPIFYYFKDGLLEEKQ